MVAVVEESNDESLAQSDWFLPTLILAGGGLVAGAMTALYVNAHATLQEANKSIVVKKGAVLPLEAVAVVENSAAAAGLGWPAAAGEGVMADDTGVTEEGQPTVVIINLPSHNSAPQDPEHVYDLLSAGFVEDASEMLSAQLAGG
ncbi:hypothetical protein CYMTET_8498 [Cymbomonas tetramitiformis]|uniref:Uncharacterized protein n=1 Tax=Cymbomonas tetramitiformis TaxID=36881 RepID=A0AAE0GT67_9CHLO|nr:hypothetical protein CYMTET_8498 [Cymbomonas tetramitiformis]